VEINQFKTDVWSINRGKVQEKNITFPTDTKLHKKIIEGPIFLPWITLPDIGQ